MKPIELVMRDLCEMTPAQIEHEDTIVVSIKDIETVLNRNFADLLRFVERIAGCDGTMIEGTPAARKARELLGIGA